MFHFPTFPPTALYIQTEVAGHDSGLSRFPHSEIPGSGARLPAPLGLSQVTTSFFGSWCQGIHRSHLVACHTHTTTIFYKDARVHCEVLKIRAHTTTPHTQRRTIMEPHRKTSHPTGCNRSLRTQQHAYNHPPPPSTFHTTTPHTPVRQATAVLASSKEKGQLIKSQCSTNQ